MGMLDAHALRAARVVVDIGLHCRMRRRTRSAAVSGTPPRCSRFVTAHTRMGPESTLFETERFSPGRGERRPTRLGEQVWLDLQDAARRQGRRVLRPRRRADSSGSLGLDVLTLS